MNIRDVVEKLALACMEGKGVSREDALTLAGEDCGLKLLLKWAGKIRDARMGKVIHLCSIVNARSGNCSEDCSFCAQSGKHATASPVYPLLSRQDLVAAAKEAFEKGISCFGIVTSGYLASNADVAVIGSAVEEIRSVVGNGMEIGASLGCLRYEELRFLKNAGLSHYNHNLETSKEFYPSICKTHRWEDRRKTIESAVNAGLSVCSGGIFGLGESWTDRIDLMCELRELGVNNVPVNFLMPIEGTPLNKNNRLKEDEALRIVALFRFLLPDANIRICGGRSVVFGKRQEEMFDAGVSGLLTGNYLTEKGIAVNEDKALIENLDFNSANATVLRRK